MVQPDTLIRYIRIFSELGSQMKYASQKRILLEIAIIKLCKPQMEADYTSLEERLDDLENKLESGAFTPPSTADGVQPQRAAEPVVKPELPKAIPDDIKNVMKNWRPIISELGGLTKQFLNMAVPSLGSMGELLLVFDDANAYSYLNENKAGCVDQLKQMIADRIGKQVEIQLRMNESGHRAADTVPDLRQLINFEVEEEDF